MITALAIIVGFSVLVVFHELGHYWVARRCDVKVLRFSIGFGKVLYVKRVGRDRTEWAISAIPLGGYVKMLDEREGEVAPHELPRAFNRKPVLQRMLIVVAGPVANILLAIVLHWALFIHGVPGLKPVMGEVAAGTPAALAQLEPKETIAAINGAPMPSWDEVRWALIDIALQHGNASLEVRAADGTLHRHELDLSRISADDLNGDFLQKLGLQPYQPLIKPVIGELVADSVAERSGLRPGDTILRSDGVPMKRWEDWVDAVRGHPGRVMRLDVLRDGRELVLDITPDTVRDGGKAVGKIGAAPRIDEQDREAFKAMLVMVSYPPVAALSEALHKTWETAWVSLSMMGKMVVGQLSLKNISGPITIADYAGQAAHIGLGVYLGFLAFFSISLGVLNILPIPLLDGGHLLYYTAELIKGSPVSEAAWEAGQKVGIALLVALMAVALYNDISRLIFG